MFTLQKIKWFYRTEEKKENKAQTVKNPPTRQETWVLPWVGKSPWRREWLPTPVFWPGQFHGQKSLVGTVRGVTKSWAWLTTSTFTFIFSDAITEDCVKGEWPLEWRNSTALYSSHSLPFVYLNSSNKMSFFVSLFFPFSPSGVIPVFSTHVYVALIIFLFFYWNILFEGTWKLTAFYHVIEILTTPFQ